MPIRIQDDRVFIDDENSCDVYCLSNLRGYSAQAYTDPSAIITLFKLELLGTSENGTMEPIKTFTGIRRKDIRILDQAFVHYEESTCD